MDFSSALEAHLGAVQRRDFEAAVATLADSDKLTLILPNGIQLLGREQVEEFFQTWFSDPEWRMRTELLHTVETDTMALALLMVEYDDLDPSGQPYQLHYYLSLTFMHVDNRWLLIHDQNTLVHEGR